jgi:hypothetical protein
MRGGEDCAIRRYYHLQPYRKELAIFYVYVQGDVFAWKGLCFIYGCAVCDPRKAHPAPDLCATDHAKDQHSQDDEIVLIV